MSVYFKKARDFVYANGVLWERALFAYLFEDGSLDHLHQCLACYVNPDGGWGHGIEHDIRTPESHPLAMEFALSVLVRDFDIPTGHLFDDASDWIAANQNADGSLKNPDSVLDYPHAPWWNEGGQTMPDSIVGNLAKIGKASPQIIETTKQWAGANLKIETVEWLFMAYHGYDYLHIDDSNQQQVIHHIVKLANAMPENQYYSLFQFVRTPDSPIAQAFPMDKYLDYFESNQGEDGGWVDQHNLPQWYPYATMIVLAALKNFGRL